MVHQAAIRDDLDFVDYLKEFRRASLERWMRASQSLRLAYPQVPYVPFGRIGPPRPEGRGPRLRFRVKDDAASDIRVEGADPGDSGFRFDTPLLDDGFNGDERAGDRVYSALVETPPNVETLSYQYYRDSSPEFTVPADIATSNADRRVLFNRDSDLPVERFGIRELMSDSMHPDAEGHRRIAEVLVARIESFSAFRRAVSESEAAIVP